jgi:hypothetical protein
MAAVTTEDETLVRRAEGPEDRLANGRLGYRKAFTAAWTVDTIKTAPDRVRGVAESSGESACETLAHERRCLGVARFWPVVAVGKRPDASNAGFLRERRHRPSLLARQLAKSCSGEA